MRLRMVKLGIISLAFCLLLAPVKVYAAQAYNVDFNDVEIRKVIETVSEITGKNFLVDDRVQGKVTVIGPKSLTSPELYQVFLSILNVKGFAVVPSGKINKVVPSANIAGYGVQMKVGRSEGITGIDAYVTQIIPVEYTEAEELKNLLVPLIPKTDNITAYGPTNILIVTTTESLLARINQVISMVDVPGAREEIRLIPVNYASVQDLAAKVSQVLQSQSGSAQPAQRTPRGRQPPAASSDAKIIADERTNTLIAIGDSQALDRIQELVSKLDVSIPQGAGKVRVYYLQNADAGELSSVLTGIPLAEAVNLSETAPGQPAPQPAARPQTKKSDISIIADPSTNALVITATPEEYEALIRVIEKLDIPREQVLVEVLIAEVSFTRTMELGVEWRIADDLNGDAAVFAGSSFGEFNQLVANPAALPNGLVVGAIGETISFGDLEFPNLGALITALKTDSDINILSTPTIVTTDNKEAEIIVGQTVPFQTSQKFDSNNQPIFTFDYRDVGLTLRLTPQINSSNYVKMDIFSKLEALVSSTIGTSELAPTTLKRQANTTVVVKDGNTVVIGGMIRDDKVENVSRVPFFGSLPLIGPLFRSQSTRSEKSNLLIFLTPHIISNSKQLQDAARGRMEGFQEFPDADTNKKKDHKEFPGEVRKRMNLGESETDIPVGSEEQE
ncbi:MAG: type II secretion system secretin GspD [bacterium]|nr:type II secretion system secretin GspD [bacterium]MDT8365067.1 type II secretion system secretin GspD [bacterium]